MQPLPTAFLEDVHAASAVSPHHCDAWNALGLRQWAARDVAAAAQSFANAAALSDQYHHYIHYACSEVFCLRAAHRLAQEDWPGALADLDAAIFQDHGNRWALSARAWLRNWLEGPETAQAELDNARYYAGELAIPPDWRGLAPYREAFDTEEEWRGAVRLPGRAGEAPCPESILHPMGLRLAAREDTPELDAAVHAHKLWHHAYHRAAATHRLNHALALEALGQNILAWQEAEKASVIDPGWELPETQRDRLAALAKAV